MTSSSSFLSSTEPLPSYTKSWGAHLSRPTELPDSYDDRIDADHIFVFSVHPVSGIKRPFYVTSRACENCAKIRQVCSRTRPSCRRCETAGKRCVVSDGWVKLSGPKCEKPKLKKSKDDEEEEPPSKKAKPDIPHTRTRSLRPHPRGNTTDNFFHLDDSDYEQECSPSTSAARVRPRKGDTNRKAPGVSEAVSQIARRRASGRGKGTRRGSGRKVNAAARSSKESDSSECRHHML